MRGAFFAKAVKSVALPTLQPRLAFVGVDCTEITAPVGGPARSAAAKATGAQGAEMHNADTKTTEDEKNRALMVKPPRTIKMILTIKSYAGLRSLLTLLQKN